jgi:hypothetical protein
VAREVLFAVRRSFITPFDRSDIRGLTNSLDDSIDQMQKTAKVITLYEMRVRAAHAPAGRHRRGSGDADGRGGGLLPAMRKPPRSPERADREDRAPRERQRRPVRRRA